MTQSDRGRKNVINTLLIVLIGQVGCLTLVVILLSVWGGLWLDNTFHTKPVFTLVLLLAGIPVSVIVMLLVARRTLAKLKMQNESKEKESS
ncbi:MAG: AtpZ/AtpI family protein [Chloroflexi bacterium]|nr:AtpZ/AtpI family protein [Chloroflexota bacterium]